MAHATFDDLERLDLRIATVLRAEPNRGARDPAISLWLDVGHEDPVQSSARIADRHRPEELVGRQVVVAAGFDAIRVGGFRSDVLVLGALDPDGVVLLIPDGQVAPGTSIA